MSEFDKCLAEAIREAKYDTGDTCVVRPDAIARAPKVHGLLPAYLPIPEIFITPDGDIGFDWHADNNKYGILSILLSENNTINYSFYTNDETEHGSFKKRTYYSLPKKLLKAISRWKEYSK